MSDKLATTVMRATVSAPVVPAFAEWEKGKQHVRLPNGQMLAFIDLGESEEIPLLLLHGLTDSSVSFAGITPFFPGRRLIIPDLRGHGASGRPQTGYSVTDFAEDARLLLTELGIRRAEVVGHSLGGMVAQCLTGLYPETTSRLILIGTSLNPTGPSGRLSSELEKLETLEPDGDFLKRWYANPGNVPEPFLAKLRLDASTMPIIILRQILHELAQGQTNRRPLITKPALLIWGEEDPFFDLSHQEALLSAIPGASLSRLPGHGHNPFWESPERVASLMRDFLVP